MREYGKVYTTIWTGRARELSEDGRLLLLYLLTSPHSNGVGCYRLPVAYIADDLCWGISETVSQTVPVTVTGTVSQTIVEPSARVLSTLSELVSKGFIERDDQRGWVRIINWFEHNIIENPNVAKSFMPFIDAVPKDSTIYQGFIDSLQPHAKRFPDGYIRGLLGGCDNGMPNGSGNGSAMVAVTESSSSSQKEKERKITAAASSEDTREGLPVDKSISLKNYDAAAACAAAVQRRMLTPADEVVLLKWHKDELDIENDVLPVLQAKALAYMKKNGAMPSNPLCYFDAAVREKAKAQKSSKMN